MSGVSDNKMKGYSDVIRKQGDDARQSARQIEQQDLRAKLAESLKRAQGAESAQDSTKSAKDVARTAQDTSKVGQEQAKHAERFNEAQQDARRLTDLARSKDAARGAEKTTVTRDALAPKSEVRRADIDPKQRPPQQAPAPKAPAKPQAQNVVQHAAAAKRPVAEKQVAKNVQPSAAEPQKDAAALKAAAEKAPQAAAPAAPASPQAKAEGSRSEKADRAETKDEKKAEKKESGETGYASGAHSGKKMGGRLDSLCSGFGSGGDPSPNAGPESQGIACAQARPPLPETDPSLCFYNEQGAGDGLVSKAQLFSRLVEQRLCAIAKLDYEMGLKLRGLSERVVGELKDELQLADFLKNVNGGLRG